MEKYQRGRDWGVKSWVDTEDGDLDDSTLSSLYRGRKYDVYVSARCGYVEFVNWREAVPAIPHSSQSLLRIKPFLFITLIFRTHLHLYIATPIPNISLPCL
jgi:hypothetical protein